MTWLFEAGLLLVAFGALLAWHRLRERPAEPTARKRSRPRLLPPGKPAPYDLANEKATKHQRYLM
jgi:hypothetical protein